MLHSTLFAIIILSGLSSAAPYQHERRQIDISGLTAPVANILSSTVSSLNILNSTVSNSNISSSTVSSLNSTFDYVIIGGGTAGLVMANRLSQNPTVKVALIEAGGYYETVNPIFSTTPGLDGVGIGADPSSTNSIDWNFVTQPQSCLNNRKVHYARGKCLGGSSARNFMIYQRGTKQSYDQWASAVGDNSYTFQNLLPYFKKSVQFTPPDASKRFPNATAEFNASAFDHSGGPLQVSYPNYAQPWSTWVQPALNAIGVPTVQDFNSGSLLGAQWSAQTIRPTGETRDSSESSFLAATAGRPNLYVFNNTMAKKINFSGTTATGVTVNSTLGTFQLKATKEVIVSAGAFQSPQLLMVSGIGPAATLKKLNIPVVQNRAGVGQGMQDHIFFGPSYRVNVPTLTRQANDPAFFPTEYAGEYQSGLGPLTNNGADFLGWEKIPQSLRANFNSQTLKDLAQFPTDWPEIEFFASPAYTGNFSDLSLNQPKDGYQYATILTALVAPLSRGTVSISSADTNNPPLIDPGWLTSTTDQQVAIAAYKRARAAFSAKVTAPVLIGPEYYPGSAVSSDAQILATIKSDLMTVWHASCTCAMGKASNSMAVVDPSAKVIGVTGLRVVDASSFPLLPPGHPQSTVYALAEKIADMINNGK